MYFYYMTQCNENREFNYCTILHFLRTIEAISYVSHHSVEKLPKTFNSVAWIMYSFLGHTLTHTNFTGFLSFFYQTTFHNVYGKHYTKAHRWCSDIITVDSVLLWDQYT